MSVTIPTTQELADRNIAIIEGKLNQTTPAANKAYNRVIAVVLAEIETELNKKATSDKKQNLALTADESGLNDIGENRGIERNPAESTVLTIEGSAEAGKVLPATVSFVGDSNSVRYFPDNSAGESGGVISVSVTAEEVGVSGNLEVGQTLSISSQLAGIDTSWIVTAVDNTGTDGQSLESYRQEILDDQRTLKGGANPADYRRWSKAVSGVAEAFPYSKLPYDDPSYPGIPPERTVYIEAEESIDLDGIAPTGLLDEVRDAIEISPTTGLSNQPLGITNETLYVESIRRRSIYIEIKGLIVDPSVEVSTKSDLEAGLDSYLRELQPFIEGLDFDGDRNETITAVSLSEIVEGIVSSVGGSVSTVRFGTSPGTFTSLTLTLGEGEKVKSGGVTYVA